MRTPTALDAWRRWTADLDPRARDLDVDSQDLFPLVYRNLGGLGADSPYAPLLKGAYRYWWCSNQRRLHRVAALLDQLRDAGVPALLLGDAGTAVQFYQDLGARPLKSIDVMVPPDQSRAALALLRRVGWRQARGRGAAHFRFRGGARMVAEGGQEIDLSWRSWSGSQDGRADQGFWRRSAPVAIHHARSRGLAAGDALLQTVVEPRRGGAAPDLWWIADVLTILAVAADRVDWDTLVEEAGARRIQLHITSRLEYLRSRFAAPIPRDVVERLRARTPTRLERLEFRHLSALSEQADCRRESRVARVVVEYLRIVSGRSLGAKLAGFPGFLGYRLGMRAHQAMSRARRIGDRGRGRSQSYPVRK